MAQMTTAQMTTAQMTAAQMKTAQTLVVNPINCTGHGVCAELLPELISLDEWGYPIVDPRPVPPVLDREARRAVAACPALALKLMRN
jgi:ferredoxin